MKALPFNDENLEDFLAAFVLSGTIADACKELGVTERAITKWKALPVYNETLAAVKEAEKSVKLGVDAEGAFAAAGFPEDRYHRMLRLKPFRAGLRKWDGQRKVEAVKRLVVAAGPRKKTSQSTERTVDPNGSSKTKVTVVETETASVPAAKALLGLPSKTTSETDLTGEKPVSELVPQPHGGALQNGPGRGRPKGSKATLTMFAEILTNEDPDAPGYSLCESIAIALVRETKKGNVRAAELALLAIEKVGGVGGQSQEQGATPLDPLFAKMTDEQLNRLVKARLVADDFIEAELLEDEVAS